MSTVLEVDSGLDLYVLLYPSFAFPLFDVTKDKLVKKYGVCRGLIVRKREGSRVEIIHDNRLCMIYAEEVLGLWFKPSTTSQVSRRYRDLVERLLEIYEWFGIATSSQDDVELFSSMFLSQNTDFHRNVVKWLNNIFGKYGAVDKIAEIDVKEIARNIGSSYQVIRLREALRRYLELREMIKEYEIERSKRYLMSIEYVGPKIFNSYALFVKKSPWHAPIDKNFISFLKKFDITRELVAEMPKKSLCLNYDCFNCPMGKRCTYRRVRDAFGQLSGWLQTLAYAHNGLVCRHKLCMICHLRPLCTKPRNRG